MSVTLRQFLIFLITGGIAATANFTSRIFYNMAMSFSFAVILAYITGMIVAFLLARRFVFERSSHNWRTSFFYFTLVNLVAAAQTWAISVGLAYYLLPWLAIETFRFEIAHMIGITIPVFTSFIGHKYFAFRERSDKASS